MVKKRAKGESELVELVGEDEEGEEGEPTLDEINEAMGDLASTTED